MRNADEVFKMTRRIAKARRRLARHVQYCLCTKCNAERATIDRLDNTIHDRLATVQTGDYERYMR